MSDHIGAPRGSAVIDALKTGAAVLVVLTIAYGIIAVLSSGFGPTEMYIGLTLVVVALFGVAAWHQRRRRRRRDAGAA